MKKEKKKKVFPLLLHFPKNVGFFLINNNDYKALETNVYGTVLPLTLYYTVLSPATLICACPGIEIFLLNQKFAMHASS